MVIVLQMCITKVIDNKTHLLCLVIYSNNKFANHFCDRDLNRKNLAQIWNSSNNKNFNYSLNKAIVLLSKVLWLNLINPDSLNLIYIQKFVVRNKMLKWNRIHTCSAWLIKSRNGLQTQSRMAFDAAQID